MKKAKIMLTAITVLAVVGGALAFKAKKFTERRFYCTTTTNAACTLANSISSFSTFTNAVVPLTTTYCSTQIHIGGTGDPCPYVKLTDSE